jgi:F-type H+-transporting ATPase subunit b
MQELLRELGQLVLGSVPTMILFLILLGAYHFILYRPLVRVRAERYKRTKGAVERAMAAIAAADVKSQEYEAKLRAARAEIQRAREAQMQQWNAERESVLASARLLAKDRMEVARKEIASQTEAARRQLQAGVGRLADQIMEAVLPAAESTR